MMNAFRHPALLRRLLPTLLAATFFAGSVVSSLALPDLVMPSLTTRCENGLIQIAGRVENRGTAAAGAFEVTVYLTYPSLDFYTIATLQSPGLAAGAGSNFSLARNLNDYPYDTYSYLEAVADLANAIPESDDENNRRQSDYFTIPCEGTQPAPDFQAVRVFFLDNRDGTGSPVASPQPGQSLYPYFEFLVSGAGPYQVPLAIGVDGQALCSGEVGVEGGSGRTVPCSDPYVIPPGAHVLEGVLDPSGTVAEPNETNNRASFSWGGAATPSPTPAPTASPSPTPAPTSTPAPAARVSNISTRGFVGSGAGVMIGGLIVQGTGARRVLVSGIGPDLANFGVAGVLPNPTLALYKGAGAIASNDDWGLADNKAEIGASGYAPGSPLESAILLDLAPGEYTAILSGTGSGATTGVGLVQAFDLGPAPGGGEGVLGNISTRLSVGTGDRVMIGGFTVSGSEPMRVLVRGLGPTLGAPPFDVAGALANPELAIYSGSTRIAQNDDWIESADKTAIAATGLAPPDSREPAILMTLAPGAYTGIVSGVGGTEGVALIEVYAP